MSAAPIERVIKAAVDRGASDIHIKAGDQFRARIDGRLVPLTKQRLTPAQTRSIAQKLLGSSEERTRLDRLTDFDCSWGLAGVGRFRVSLLRQRSSFMIVMRVIPFSVPTLEELGLPEGVAALVESESGLLLVTGESGSGTSSTIAAMLHHLNQTTERHIVTIEDPIEFLHRDLRCSVTQREVGIDTASVLTGLRAAVRHDSDVIVVGEVRDGETLVAAVRAAETGRLVIGTLHAGDAVTAVAQVLTMIPGEEGDADRLRFAETLRAVVAQRLVPRKDGRGRVALIEVLPATPSVRACLRDRGRTGDLAAVMSREGGRLGMQSFEQHLAQLVREGVVAPEASGKPERGAAAGPGTSRSRR
jgi:twitching motility protein PilT